MNPGRHLASVQQREKIYFQCKKTGWFIHWQFVQSSISLVVLIVLSIFTISEPQVTLSYQQPANSNQQQSLPPVGAVYFTGSSANPSQATYPPQQIGYPQPQTVYPSQQTGYPPAPPAGQPLQDKSPPQNQVLPPPYQAGPSHVVVVSFVSHVYQAGLQLHQAELNLN